MTTSAPTVLFETEMGADAQLSSSHNSSVTSSCNIDESYKYIFLPICYSFTFVFSITLNFVVLYRSFRHTRHWNASLIYMVNLATTDFMYGLSLPFLVASYVMRDDWVFGDFMCRLVRFLFYFNLYCSIFFLTCISVHRYLGICHPMKTITLETKRAVKGTCVLVWIAVFALTCPIFHFAKTQNLPREGKGSREEMFINCWDDAIDKEFHDYIPYGGHSSFLGLFCAVQHHCLVLLACSVNNISDAALSNLLLKESEVGRAVESVAGRIGGESRSSSWGLKSPYAKRRRKSIRTLITITLLFALCFFPFHVTRTVFLLLKVTSKVQCTPCVWFPSVIKSLGRWPHSTPGWMLCFTFLPKRKNGSCCQKPEHAQHGMLWPLRMLGKGEEEENEVEEIRNHKDNGTTDKNNILRGLP